jgi:hypothetical protein
MGHRLPIVRSRESRRDGSRTPDRGGMRGGWRSDIIVECAVLDGVPMKGHVELGLNVAASFVAPLDDRSLWDAFQAGTLPESEWKHRTHLRIAFSHLARWDADEAHLRMRVGIIRLNAIHGLKETTERGYHETLTRAWLALVGHAKKSADHANSDSLLAAHAELLDKELVLRFYSRERLMSPRARAIFVEPDRAALPSE